jgi:hypothetical protein
MNENPLSITVKENGKVVRLSITWTMMRMLWIMAPVDPEDGPVLAKGTRAKWVCDALVRRGLAMPSYNRYPEYSPQYQITRKGQNLLTKYGMHPADNIGRLLSRYSNEELFGWVDIPY